jgi:putative Mg2+ transporter-C (MgtC) family protein
MSMLDAFLNELSTSFAVVPWQVAFLRMIFALALGAAIGWEREWHHKAAGIRTHMLIALASCLVALIGYELTKFEAATPAALRTDPLRLIGAVTSGVAFLAAGTIIVAHEKVKGLTTGASMWLSGTIGLATGIGHLVLAAMTTALALIVLGVIRMLEPSKDDDSSGPPD